LSLLRNFPYLWQVIFSKACEYGLRATLFIAMNSLEHRRVSLRNIANKIDSPEAFTAKILQQLVHHEIIQSVKGAHGGFEIDEERLQHINLSQIITAIDGESIFNRCVMGLAACSEEHPCPAHATYIDIRNQLQTMLRQTHVMDLSHDLESGQTFLKQ